MKIGIIPVNLGIGSVEQMVGVAQHAEARGYESVRTFEAIGVHRLVVPAMGLGADTLAGLAALADSVIRKQEK
jgi:hypothetical protein